MPRFFAESGGETAGLAAGRPDAVPRLSAKRLREPDGGARPSKSPCLVGSAALFEGMQREEYIQKRVLPKLQARTAELSDQALADLGSMDFGDALGGVGAPRGAAEPKGDLFGGGGREAYMQQHVHRKLHGQAAAMSDEELLELGRLSFNDQFGVVEGGGSRVASQAAGGQGQQVDIFGGASREAFMMQHVHRKLHGLAAALSNEELLSLGKLSFNEQFPWLGADGSAGAAPPHVAGTRAPAGDLFRGLGREGYMAQRVHKRLHVQAAALSDQELFDLGQLSFNQQFPYFEVMPAAVVEQTPSADVFQGFAGGREGYMQQRVHRRLHSKAATLSDRDLLELGQQSFNDQFPLLEHIEVAPVAGAQDAGAGLLDGMSREAYMAARVHRRLHASAALLGDEQLHELGQLTFNQQFPFIEAMPPSRPSRAPPIDLFPGQGRSGYMQQRVHRRLHAQAALLSDEALLELGRLSFNEQFPAVEQMELGSAPAVEQDSVDLFGGLGRKAFVAQYVHRKLHAQTEVLSDEQLAELGRLSFNQQFPYFESLEEAAEADPASVDLFGSMGREGYMQGRVHRRLHSKAAQLSDRQLWELGKLSFNDQFPALDNVEA